MGLAITLESKRTSLDVWRRHLVEAVSRYLFPRRRYLQLLCFGEYLPRSHRQQHDGLDGLKQDFTEVDNNVTRHVPYEMSQSDWNGLVMHYLGVDHIGHKSGPSRYVATEYKSRSHLTQQSPYMHPKQKEMDEVVKIIYEAVKSRDYLDSTLIVLCGDHGMNDAGNHGGSTPGETSPALVFLSPKLQKVYKGLNSPVNSTPDDFQYYVTVEQSDVVPTLAILLGLPIPLNNLGVFIPRFLELWPNGA